MNLWHRLFLVERPTLSLSLFRIAVAVATFLHVCPSFFHFREHYLHGAFKTYNANFFPVDFLNLVDQSPDWLIILMLAVLFCSWLLFLLGCYTQPSGWILFGSLLYFYALNDFYIGSSLAWDLLLVTLFLVCLTPYPGDYFSVDALRRRDPNAYKAPRPYFIQRLLQIQLAATFFFTALYKIYPEGNWIKDNPLYYLMLYPDEGSTKNFLLRDFLAVHPALCYWTGIFIFSTEFLLPFLLFFPATRRSGIIWGFIFHLMLLLTLDVPAIFFFLFPPQMLLFINPEKILERIEVRRKLNLQAKRSIVVFDGQCNFCRLSVRHLEIMDLWGRLQMRDFHTMEDLTLLHPDLNHAKAASQLYLIEPDGRLSGGFFAFRRLSLLLPMLYPCIILFYFPGTGLMGPWVYAWIAKNRYLFHINPICVQNACFRKGTHP